MKTIVKLFFSDDGAQAVARRARRTPTNSRLDDRALGVNPLQFFPLLLAKSGDRSCVVLLHRRETVPIELRLVGYS